MTQTEPTSPISACLTADQTSAWARRGFLILKDFVPPADVRAAVSLSRPADGRAHPADALVQALSRPVAELLDADPVLLSLERRTRELFGMDALSSVSAWTSTIAAVVVTDASAAARFAFYPRSHLVPVPEADGSPVAAMDRVAAELRLRGLDRQTLQATVGDVWLGHPRLMRGSLGAETAGGQGWLKATFGRRLDLPSNPDRSLALAGSCGIVDPSRSSAPLELASAI